MRGPCARRTINVGERAHGHTPAAHRGGHVDRGLPRRCGDLFPGHVREPPRFPESPRGARRGVLRGSPGHGLFEKLGCSAGIDFFFGFLAVLAAVGLARMYRGNTVLLLVLGGVISSALFTSLFSMVKYIADPYNQLPAITQWLMGGLALVDKKTLLVVGIPQVVSMALITLFSGYLNALSMGDEEARALGIPVEWVRMLLIFLATGMSALTVVLAGMIGWVGLIIPHIARMLIGPNNKILIPASALIGAIYLVAVDDVSRMLFNVEIPIGITTSLIGIPFFAVILRKAKRGWS